MIQNYEKHTTRTNMTPTLIAGAGSVLANVASTENARQRVRSEPGITGARPASIVERAKARDEWQRQRRARRAMSLTGDPSAWKSKSSQVSINALPRVVAHAEIARISPKGRGSGQITPWMPRQLY